jgi:hypothetical protein
MGDGAMRALGGEGSEGGDGGEGSESYEVCMSEPYLGIW